jgi:hypothetical protein
MLTVLFQHKGRMIQGDIVSDDGFTTKVKVKNVYYLFESPLKVGKRDETIIHLIKPKKNANNVNFVAIE